MTDLIMCFVVCRNRATRAGAVSGTLSGISCGVISWLVYAKVGLLSLACTPFQHSIRKHALMFRSAPSSRTQREAFHPKHAVHSLQPAYLAASSCARCD